MLYKLNLGQNRENYQKVKRVSLASLGWKEKDLQNLISKNMQDFISSNDLMPIFNERDRQEEPDILALDSEGDLYIFELKRWEGKQENLLQVLRYGQLFGSSNYDELNSLYQKFEHDKQANLFKSHSLYFSGKRYTELAQDDFNRHQHFVVVTNGLDQSTVESIIYWRKAGLNVDALIYWVFEIGGEYYMEFGKYSQVEDFLEYENNCYVLNTDYNNEPAHDEAMLREHKAAAYDTGWKEKIKKFQKGDIVFLYRSGTGIVAYGKANGELQKVDEGCLCEYEYNMHLDDFVQLENPISAAKMKEIAQCGFSFRSVLFSISDEAASKIIHSIK